MKKIIFCIMFLLFPIATFSESAEFPQQKVLTVSGGRYIFGQISEYRRDQYLLDTQTGRLWKIVTNEDGVEVLQTVPFLSLTRDGYSVVPESSAEVKTIKSLTITPKKNKPEQPEPLLPESK